MPKHGDLDDHHIIPASWGAKIGTSSSIHTILNRTPLTSETNRKIIGDRLPNMYLPELITSNGEVAVRSILESHFISRAAQDILQRNPFTPDDFEEFIIERQRTIQDAIEHLLIKERLDLTPQLRELDEQLEHIELNVRNLIANELTDEHFLPPHILQKTDERIHLAMRKNPALEPSAFQNIYSRLEYADLRELQDIIMAKDLWSRFEPRFKLKEPLNAKFNQIAELRNAIRHSRTVNDIVRKEGEAAIIWFRQILAK